MSEQHYLLNWLIGSEEQTVVIASVIRVEGSAYRHQGAQMIIGEEGTTQGMISGGCLEEDLFIRARRAMQTMQVTVVDYDMRAEDDLGWGKGAGCNGKVYVSLEPVKLGNPDTLSVLQEANRMVRQGHTLYRIRNLDEEESCSLMYYTSSGKALRDHDPDLYGDQLKALQQSGEPAVCLDGNEQGRMLVERITPKPVVYVFGAGLDVEPLIQQLALLDFSPVLIDTIKERLDRDLFPGAAGFRWMTPADFFEMEQIPVGSYAVVMTHKFQEDRVIVNELMKQKERFAYIGILGPKRRTKRLLTTSKIPEELHVPVGLDIGAEGAQEIAVSIAAELIQVKRQKQTVPHSQKAVM